MSERKEFEATNEARGAVLHEAGHERPSGDHMDALLRYLKGTGHGRSTGAADAKPLDDDEIRARAEGLVLAAGGEVGAVIVTAGSVWLRGRVSRRSTVARLQRSLAEIPGVTHVELRLGWDIDDAGQLPAPE